VQENGLLPINFTISEAAKNAINAMRADYDAAFPNNPAVVPAIGWAYVNPRCGVE
jgi:putative cell wall-binding protein